MKATRERIPLIVRARMVTLGISRPQQSMFRLYLVVVACLVCQGGWLVESAPGDTLQLRNGTALVGGLVSYDGQILKFVTDQGVQSVSREQALVLTFTAPTQRVPQQPAAATPTPVAPPPLPSGPLTIPAGTMLLVSTTSQVSSESPMGQRFSANLAADLKAGSVVIAPAGTQVYGQVIRSGQAGRLAGKSTLELALSEINIKGTVYPLITTNFAEAGKSSFGKTVRNVGMGALIGGVFGDSDDAKKGAAIGAGVSLLRRGQSVVVPPGAMLEFRMTQPLTVTP